jgi:hypothetical protein
VYKPGAEVKARVLCLLPSFQPCTDVPQVRLLLKNPDGNKVPLSLLSFSQKF